MRCIQNRVFCIYSFLITTCFDAQNFPRVFILALPPYPAQWQTNAVTVAGGQGKGAGINQLDSPVGLFVDDAQTVYITDYYNHRAIAWQAHATTGEIVAGGNGEGRRLDQLNRPTAIIVDRETDTLLICDQYNGRVVRWPRRPSYLRQGEVVIAGFTCFGLVMDDRGSLYVTRRGGDVRRYDKGGDKEGTLVAGGNELGKNLNQFNIPTFLFVDAQYNLYIADYYNDRVMKWMRGAREGIVVAGGNGRGQDLTQLSHPRGIWVDGCGHVYVAELGADRVTRWEKGAKQGTVVVGGNGKGAAANQLSCGNGLFFDRHGHLYVVDCPNYRVQRFSLITE